MKRKTQTKKILKSVEYDFAKDAIEKLKLELLKKREAGEPIPTIKSIVNSNAPIHVEARMQNMILTVKCSKNFINLHLPTKL